MEARGKEIEMREQQRPILKQITPVAQSIEMAKSEIERDSKKEGSVSVRRLNLLTRYQNV